MGLRPQWRLLIFGLTFFAGLKLIRHFGDIWAGGADGYRRGNRRRAVSILCLEWIMLHFDLVIYAHLFSYFNGGNNDDSKAKSARSNGSAAQRMARFKYFCVYVAVMLLAHLTYLFYLLESFELPWPVVEVSGVANGIWLHLVAFSLAFVSGNLFIRAISVLDCGHRFVELLSRLPVIKSLVMDSKFQVRVTLVVTLLLCLVQWMAAGNLTIRHITVPLSTFPNNNNTPPLRMALLTDLHGGASVYREHIARVVDAVNELEVDVVLIVGDAVDAPRNVIEERMQPLAHLRSRLGTYFTTGNHEYYYGDVEEWIRLFQSYGIHPLLNSHTILNGSTCLVGLNDISAGKNGIPLHFMDVSAIGECSQEEPVVILAHNPAAAKEIMEYSRNESKRVDLILAGHTHAGQYYVIVPYVYWLLPYFYGLYDLGNSTRMLVSAGTLYQGSPMKMPFMSEVWVVELTFN